MKGWLTGLILGVLFSCTNEPESRNSTELQKIVLADRFFPGDKVQISTGNWAIVLFADSNQVEVLVPGQEGTQKFPPQNLTKIQSARLLRGLEPGMPIRWATLTEPSTPRFQDSLGYSYYYTLGEDKFFRVDYYCKPGSKPSIISSIFLEISFKVEADAIRFYREFSGWLESQYGQPVGQLGDFYWSIVNKPLRLHLALSGQKKNITLSIEQNTEKQQDI